MKITVKQLKKLGACKNQVVLFQSIFGESVTLTKEVVKEHGHKFDVDWLAHKLLTHTQIIDYEAKRTLLYADYEAKCAPLWADYLAKCAPLWADYLAKCAPLYADYLAKCASLDADYKAKRALVFWEVINN